MLLLILKYLNEKYPLGFYLSYKCLLFTHYMQNLKRFLSKSSSHYLTKVKVKINFLPSTLHSLILFPWVSFPPVLYLLPKKTFNFLFSPHFSSAISPRYCFHSHLRMLLLQEKPPLILTLCCQALYHGLSTDRAKLTMAGRLSLYNKPYPNRVA